MCGIFPYIYHKNQLNVNVGKYTIVPWYGPWYVAPVLHIRVLEVSDIIIIRITQWNEAGGRSWTWTWTTGPPPQRHNVQKSGKISHYLQVFIYPRWLFGISSINSNMTMENSSHEDVSPIFQHGDFPPIAVLGFQGPGCTFFCETTGKDMERLDLFFDLLRLSFHTVFIQGRSPTSWAL